MRIENEKLIAAKIKGIIKKRGMKQVDLAKQIDVPPSSLSKMLSGVKGYPLNPSVIQDICNVLELDYNDIVTIKVSQDYNPLTNEDFVRGIAMMTFEKLGVDTSFVKICGNIVYKRNKYTNYLFFNGTNYYTQEDMEKLEAEEKKNLTTEDLDLNFEEFYEVRYDNVIKRMSVSEYNHMIDSVKNMLQYALDFIFHY